MASSNEHQNDQPTQSTSLVKYLQILPREPIIEPDVWPTIPLQHLSIDLIQNMKVSYYRELYNKTGSMWLWTDRNFMSDETLHRIISDPEVSIHVLRVDVDAFESRSSATEAAENGANTDNNDKNIAHSRAEGEKEDAGYFELEWRKDANGDLQVEISYFGLMPKYIGKRLGQWFLWELLKTVRNKVGDGARIWVHTCNWDHPKAYATYVRGGFKYYKEEIEPITVPPGYKHVSQN